MVEKNINQESLKDNKISKEKWIDELSAFTRIFEIVGLQFFTPKNVNESNVNSNPSALRKVYAIFLSITFAGIVGFIMRSDKAKQSETKVDINNVVVLTIRRASTVILFYIILICIIQSYVFTKSFKKVFLNLRILLNHFKKEFNFDENLSEFLRQTKIRLVVLPITVSFLHSIFLATPIIWTGKYDDGLQLDSLILYFVLLFMAVLTMRTVFYIRLMNHLMIKLEVIFNDIFKYSKMKLFKSAEIREQIYATTRSGDTFNDVSTKLLAVRKAYNIILENTEYFNKSSGLTLFCYLIGFIITTIVAEYEFFLLIVEGIEMHNVVNSSYGFVTCLVLCGPIFFHSHRLRVTVSF